MGFFLRCYKSTRRNIGLTFVLESLVPHGKAAATDIASPPPIKRKVDYFGERGEHGRAQGSDSTIVARMLALSVPQSDYCWNFRPDPWECGTFFMFLRPLPSK
ncbi:hypothetical protein V8E36_003821 [Tilletia maclaganii]